MSDTPRSPDDTTGLPRVIPPQPREGVGDDQERDGVDVVPAATKPAEQLGFQMRFEAGKALLALEQRPADDGVVVRRALFEVPDVAFPLDVSGGALRFQNRRLTLRAVELAVTWEALFVADALARHGLTLVRERSRAGGLEIVVTIEGPAGPVPLRARCIFAPVGDGGVALVLHELIGFMPLPRRRLELAPALLDALRFPGGLPARAMIRRAEPFRAVFSRLLPLHGWKVPSLGEVRVHETVLGKGEVVLRAWSGQAPEGWKAARPTKGGPLQDAISLAVFADDLAIATDDAARLRLVDRMIDGGAVAPSAVPFVAELLRADPRRRADGDELIARALEADDEHLGLRAAWAETADIDDAERARRLMALSEAADGNDEPWVAGRAALEASRLRELVGDVDGALAAAAAAVEADPSVAEAGMRLARLQARRGDLAAALAAGRAALERAGSGSLIEPAAELEAADTFTIFLADVARRVEGADAARALLRRALRARERPDALVPLVELDIESGALERAAEGLARLLVAVGQEPALQKHVELLAARLASERGDRETARAHLLRARDLDPRDATVALRLATLAEESGDLERAADALAGVVDAEDDGDVDDVAPVHAARFAAARLSLRRARAGRGDVTVAAERSRALLARLPVSRQQEADVVRLDAEARALLGDAAPLGQLLLADADRAQDRRAATSLRVEAAGHLLDAALVDAAAGALADAFVDGATDAVGDVVVARGGERLAAALGASLLARRPADADDTTGADGTGDAVRALARRLAGAGLPRAALVLLAGRTDVVSRELRALSAADADDIEAEIAEREALADLVEGEKRGAHLARLAVLLERAGRPLVAADVWARAASGDGVIDVVAWMRVATGDPARLAVVVARDDADVSTLPAGLLRETIARVEDAVARRRLLAALAARHDDVGDVERWLEAARELPAAEAAAAFIDAARRNQRPAWLLEGISLLVGAGAGARALASARDAIAVGDALGTDLAVQQRAFDLAIELGDADALEDLTARLLARDDLGADARREVRTRQVAAHRERVDAPGRLALLERALLSWLDVEAAALPALEGLVSLRLAEPAADLVDVGVRLAAARDDGLDADAALPLLSAVADAARERGSPAELAVRELLLACDLDDAARDRTRRRLVDLNTRAGRPGRAVELLHALIAQARVRGDADQAFAGLWQRVADLEEEELKQPRPAAEALQHLLTHAPEDAAASRRLLALLLELGDDEGLAAESLRRAALLPPSAERTDLLLRAADVATRAGRFPEARRWLLRALRHPPFSSIALAAAVDVARLTQSRRFAIRARLAAANALSETMPLEAARHAADAGGLLAGILHRNRLAIAAFVFADGACRAAGSPVESHARMLVELCRAVGDGAGAARWLEPLLAEAEGKERARLLESRADVKVTLLDDEDGAIADRREALTIDPTFSGAARALSRQLAKRGDLRGAIDVERHFIDASADGEVRGLAYARLATQAHDGVDDPALLAELCTTAIAARDDLEMHRLLVGARERLGEPAATIAARRGLLARTPDAVERLTVGARLAELQHDTGDVDGAIATLRGVLDDDGVRDAVAARATQPLPDDARFDVAVQRLAGWLAARGDLVAAAETLLQGLARLPDGPAFAPTSTQLERAGVWLDDAEGDAGTAARALAVLCDAAEAGGLSDDGEVRRARLAEELEQPAIACAALDVLISRDLDVSTNARRLARAAESAGDSRRALAAWQRWLAVPSEALPTSEPPPATAWLEVERLAAGVDDAAALRRAREALFELATGSSAERAARAIACADDALNRDADAAAAVQWLERARAIESTPALRSRLLGLLRDDDTAATARLSVLDEMDAVGDVLAAADRLDRAGLRLAASTAAPEVGRAIDDVVIAVRDADVDTARAGALLTTAAVAAPSALADALGRLEDGIAADLLRTAFVTTGAVDDQAVADDVVRALADAAPTHEALQRAVARRDVQAGQPADAVDRLLAFAARLTRDGSTSVESRAVVDDAADLAIGAGAAVLQPRLDDLRPALRRSAERRDLALAALRDVEAWEAVATVLEDAIVAVDDVTGRRRLRLQLVAVLREGIDDEGAHRRAASHLQQLVDEDVGDREAWGELFECLEGLGDKEALQGALGHRAAALASPTSLEGRQLVRRRAELLAALGRPQEAIDALAVVRPVGDDDADLQALMGALHRQLDGDDAAGPHAIAFLAAELAAAHRAADARAILALPADAVDVVSPTLRVDAWKTLVVDTASAADAAATICATSWRDGVEPVLAEAVAVAGALAAEATRHEALDAFVAGLAMGGRALGSVAALRLSDALFSTPEVSSAATAALQRAFAAAAFRRRVRVAGIAATTVDIERLEGRARDVAVFRRAARLGDTVALRAAAEGLGVPFVDVAADAAAALASMTPPAPPRLAVAAALLRHGDARAEAWVDAIVDDDRRLLAARAATLPLRGTRRGARLPMRLRLARDLAEPARDLALVADAARAEGATVLQIQALDALFATRDATAAELVARADAAAATGADDTLRWASAAADAAAADTTLADDALRLRRRAVELAVRSGERERLGREALALARQAPAGHGGDAIRLEARSTAEAAGLSEVVDAILAETEAGLATVEERVAAIRDRAALRRRQHDPLGAFSALFDASRSIDDTTAAQMLRDEAWTVATAEGLTEQALLVVDDPLAEAAMLALLGRTDEAATLARALGGAGATWLLADLARRAGDAAGEEAALAALATDGAADDGAMMRLIDASRRRGDVDDAARKALGLGRRGLTPERVRLLVDCLAPGVAPALLDEGFQLLLDVDAERVGAGLAAEALQAITARAAAAGLTATARAARQALARLKDSDEGWTALVVADVADLAADDLILSLRQRLGRPPVLRGVAAALAADDGLTARFADGLGALVRGGDAAAVADLLTPLPSRHWRLGEVLGNALEVLGRNRDAADVLVEAVQAGAPARRVLVRASELLIDAGAFGAAARALCALGAADLDDAVRLHCRDVVTRAARDGVMGDAARLAAHVGRLRGDDVFVTLALGLADAAGGDTALQIAGWRLRAGDVRALPLLAHHTLEASAAQGYFGAWHALRNGVRSFSSHAPADFARIADLAALRDTDATVPPPPSTTLERARRGRRPARQAAWRELAADVSSTDELGAARLLMRAGVTMAEAPLEVRLAVDPALADPGTRASAIAAGLADVAPARRAAVVAAFDAAVERGGGSARERLAVDAIAERRRPAVLVALDRLAVGEAVDVKALVAGLGRHPRPEERAAVAAVLTTVGLGAAAAVVLPSLRSQPGSDDAAVLTALRAVDDEEGLAALGRLRLSQLAGPRADVEERIAAIAARLGRTDLLAESLMRLARLQSGAAEQAAVLARHAAVMLTTDATRARQSALAAHRLAPSASTSSLLARVAEASNDPAAIEQALAAQVAVASDDDAADLVVRRARVLARRMLRPEDALVALDDQLAVTPAAALLEEKAAILDELLSRPRDAGLALLAAVDTDAALDVAHRTALRRRAATLLARDADVGSIEMAVGALCEAADEGDATALDEAESLARQRAHNVALARVLERRLRDTDDVNARRVLVLEQARLLHEQDDHMGALALLEAQAVNDPIDLGARLLLAEWYLKDRRILDAALAFESAARIPGLPPAGFGPPAREAASLLAALGDLERAGPLADMAVTANVTDLEVLSVAEAWHRGHERWSAVDDLLGRELEHISDARREAHLWMERAVIRADQLGDETGARKALHRVLELVPDHARALAMLRADAERSDTWGALRLALLRAVDATPDVLRQAMWLRDVAVIDANHLGDLRAAEAMVDRALGLFPDDLESLVLKANLMVRAGRIDGVAPLMERIEKLGGASLPATLQLVRGDALVLSGDRAEAVAAFREATEDPDVAPRAWDRLIDMHEGTAGALPFYEEARRGTIDDARRLSLLRREFRLRQKLGEDAVDVAIALLGVAPGDDDALAVVRDSFARRRKLKELLPLLVAHARAAGDAGMRASRLAQVAVFCVDELGQEVAARGFFEEALTVDPAQPVALVRLADIAWASRDDERALELLDRLSPEAWLAAPTDDGRARTLPELLMRRARCAWALGRADTRDRLRQVLRADARHVAALELLARLALDAQDDDGAEHALESLTQAIVPADDPVRLATTLLDLAGLRLRRGHPGEAVVAAERALELNPTSLAVLEMVGEAREAAGRHAEAAEAWRRVAALRSGPDRVRALERRVGALQAAQRFRETIDALLDLFGETGDPRHKAAAADVARQSGQHDLLQRVGATVETPRPALEPPEDTTRTQAMPVAPGIGGALVIQLRANLDAGDAARALTLAQAAQVGGPLDAESTRLAIEAAGRVGAWAEAVAMAEARLQTATEPAEVLGLALAAGRTARDHLHDDDRAAALLYQAHQADAEDIEVRLELTSLYARIPRLASHAVTGILQLLRRTPTDARVFGLAAELAEQQGQAERAIAMRGIAAVLKGSAIPQELMLGRVAEERTTAAIMPMDREAIGSRLAPTGWGSPLQQLITLLGVHLEVALGGPPPPPGAKPLVQASPRSAAMMERVDRLLPGRTVQVVMADVDRPTVCAGGVPQVVVPRDVLVHDGALAATIARGVAVVRLGALLTETVKPGREQEVLDLLRAGLLGEGSRDARSELLTARLQPDEKAAAVALARQVFSQPIDLAATLQIMSRACDRFVLVATGSAVAALQASALPTLMKEPPQRAMLLVQGSVRALELCAFAARDNAWLLRRQHLL
jgi:hypothetical protein